MEQHAESPDAPCIVIQTDGQSFWMVEGADYLTPMLMGNGYFPRPVRLLIFEDSFALKVHLGPGRAISDFWGINPDVIERLRRDNHLIEIRSPAEQAAPRARERGT